MASFGWVLRELEKNKHLKTVFGELKGNYGFSGNWDDSSVGVISASGRKIARGNYSINGFGDFFGFDNPSFAVHHGIYRFGFFMRFAGTVGERQHSLRENLGPGESGADRAEFDLG